MKKKRKIRKQTKLWKTHSGKKIRICDMSILHIQNAIVYLEELIVEQLNRDMAHIKPEDRNYSITEIREAASELAADSFSIYCSLKLEKKRREQEIQRLLGR